MPDDDKGERDADTLRVRALGDTAEAAVADDDRASVAGATDVNAVEEGLATFSVLVIVSCAVAEAEAEAEAAPFAVKEPVAVAGRVCNLAPPLLCGRAADRLCDDDDDDDNNNGDARGRALLRREKSVGLNHTVAVVAARSCGENGSSVRSAIVDDGDEAEDDNDE